MDQSSIVKEFIAILKCCNIGWMSILDGPPGKTELDADAAKDNDNDDDDDDDDNDDDEREEEEAEGSLELELPPLLLGAVK
jgi:hypothetical protein